MRKAAFFDRDGVINIDHAYVHRFEEFDFVPGVLQAAAEFTKAGYLTVIVTNQSGIGRGYYTEDDFAVLDEKVREEFRKAGARIDAVYFCPHHPEKAVGKYRCECNCRKPAPGMILQAIEEWDIDPDASIMFGDKRGDMQAALSAGIATRVLVGTDGACEPERVPECTHTAQSVSKALLTGVVPL